jgi:hypothetical protein
LIDKGFGNSDILTKGSVFPGFSNGFNRVIFTLLPKMGKE